MAAKNTSATTKKNTAKKTSGAKTAAKKTAAKTKTGAKKTGANADARKNVKARENRRFWSFILFFFGIFELFATFIKGDGLWFKLYSFNRGMFGISVFLLAPMFIYVALMIASDYTKNTLLAKVIEGTVLMLLFSAAAQIIMVGSVEGSSVARKLEWLFDNGKKLNGGGVASAALGWPLLALFKRVGAAIIILLMIFTFIMLLTDLTLPQLFRAISKPFKKGYDAVNEERYNRAERAENKAQNNPHAPTAQRQDLPQGSPFKAHKAPRRRLRKGKSDAEVDFARYLEQEKRERELQQTEGVPDYIEYDYMDIDPGQLPELDIKPREKKEDTGGEEQDKKDLQDIIAKAVERAGQPKEEPVDKNEELPLQTDQPDQVEVHVEKSGQTTLFEQEEKVPAYVNPPVDILKYAKSKVPSEVTQEEINEKADKLVSTLETYAAKARIVGVFHGPSVTRYEIEPAAGVRVNKITGLSEDIALNLAATSVRIAPVPGKPCIGVEVPNTHREMVSLRELIDSEEYRNAKGKLTFAVGKDIEGNIVIGDIAKMPHLLVAGTTGSGKSVFTNSIILSILYHASPDEVKLILIDPKKVEFPIYNNIPHLLIPVVTEPLKAAGALGWALNETIKRYNRLEANHVKSLFEYNAMVKQERKKPEDQRNEEIAKLDILPQIVIVIDEFADLMMAAKSEVEDTVCRIAQIARAAGIHMIIATQSPRKDVITGLIKSNIPSRVALSVSSIMDSRVIFDYGGAEKLLGNGDLLYKPVGVKNPIRIQSGYASTEEISAVVEFLKSEHPTQYSEEVMHGVEENIPQVKGASDDGGSDSVVVNADDELIDQAISIIVQTGQASTSFLQRKLKLGFSRASRIMDEIEEMGIIGPQEGSKPREVLISQQEWIEMRARR
ncbi:MAG: DNA translocase FtsK [Ruminococcus sp.]|nr:DNA translocase FtsK [Ruminococcus sp.]